MKIEQDYFLNKQKDLILCYKKNTELGGLNKKLQ